MKCAEFKKLTAEPVAFSSIVGQSIALMDESGRVFCQLAIIGCPPNSDYRKTASAVADYVCEKINGEPG